MIDFEGLTKEEQIVVAKWVVQQAARLEAEQFSKQQVDVPAPKKPRKHAGDQDPFAALTAGLAQETERQRTPAEEARRLAHLAYQLRRGLNQLAATLDLFS